MSSNVSRAIPNYFPVFLYSIALSIAFSKSTTELKLNKERMGQAKFSVFTRNSIAQPRWYLKGISQFETSI